MGRIDIKTDRVYPVDYMFKKVDEMQQIIENDIVGINEKVNSHDSLLAEKAKQSDLSFVTPDMFKQPTDLDDTLSIQRALDYARDNKKNVELTKDCVVSDTIVTYGRMVFDGKGHRITLTSGINKPILVSAWYANITSGTYGDGYDIRNLILIGDTTQSNNTGLILCGFWSTIENVEVRNTGKYGIQLTELNLNGVSMSTGTLVENKIIRCTVRSSQGVCFHLGLNNNNKLTDGFMQNCIANSAGASHLYIGSGAGWNINGFHAYGRSLTTSMDIKNTYHTLLSNIYIEAFTTIGMNIGSIQRSVNLSNVTIKTTGSNDSSQAVFTSKSSVFAESATVNILNLTVEHSSATSTTAVYCDGSSVVLGVSNLKLQGDNIVNVKKYDHFNNTYIKRADDLIIDKQLEDTSGAIKHDGQLLKRSFTSKYNGNTAKTIAIQLPTFIDYSKVEGRLSIHSSSFDDGAKRVTYVGEVYLSRKTTTSRVYITDIITAVGFTVAPTLTFDQSTNTLTLSFTGTNSDETGLITFDYSFHR